jgi:hypothetical protein
MLNRQHNRLYAAGHLKSSEDRADMVAHYPPIKCSCSATVALYLM